MLTTENKAQPGQGWPLYQQLLIDLFKFLYPFLRNAELIFKQETLYKGTLRCLLVLLHDFPEFLCDYHFPFCDVIPSGCVQLRNIILSAFPSTKSLPDPFSKDLKVIDCLIRYLESSLVLLFQFGLYLMKLYSLCCKLEF